MRKTAPAPNPYIPKHLVERIVVSKASVEGERKHVTVLFADLKGSLELIADRDPEEARRILDPVIDLMTEAVHRYEGTVNNVMGDGIMALFGAPLAHEDHAVRACYAALSMQKAVATYADDIRRRHAIDVQIRVGINSGEVVVRSIGGDLQIEYTAIGQTTHLAARMEQLARPGTTLVASSTARLAEGFVNVKALGPIPVKGLAQAVDVYELLGASGTRPRMRASVVRGLTRFVGRDAEIAQLETAFERAKAGHGQLVSVVGAPGVGKSRLFYEFTRPPRGDQGLILEASSLSYGKMTPYLPIIDLLRSYFRIADSDDERARREKVTGKVLALDRTLESNLPALLGLLDIATDDRAWQVLEPRARREAIVDACKRLVLRESQRQPVILVFEDLHGVDSETQSVLDVLVDALPTARILLLTNYRPEYQHTWATKSYYAQLRIDPLIPQRAGELLDELLGVDPLLKPLRQALVEQTEGNPFFIEESVRSLVESGVLAGAAGHYRLTRDVTSVQVPPSVQTVLAARIDRLPAEEKQLLQTAAVLGKDVPFGLLRAISDDSESSLRRNLASLQAAEFMYETSLFPELEYTFKHALTHQVAYASLVQDRRRALHARALAAIEESYSSNLNEHAERLAHHALQADIPEKAVMYFRRAGANAWTRGALRECVDAYEQALTLIANLPSTTENLRAAVAIRLDLSLPLTLLGKIGRLILLHGEAEPLARQLDDQPTLGRICQRMSTYAWFGAQYQKGIALAEDALRIAEATNDPALRVSARYALALQLEGLGQYRNAVDVFTLITDGADADIARSVTGFHVFAYVGSCGWLASCLGFLGDFGKAERRVYESLGSIPRDPLAEAMLANLLAAPAAFKGDFERALPLCERAVDLCESKNVAAWLPYAYSTRGWVLAWLGRLTEGLADLERGAMLHEGAGVRTHLALLYARWAEGLLLLHDWHQAREVAERARAIAVEAGERSHEAMALCVLAGIDVDQADPDFVHAEQRYRLASELAEQLGMRPLLAHCRAGLARLHRRRDSAHEAETCLASASTLYREMGMRYWLDRLNAS